jgi:hypothetical protein
MTSDRYSPHPPCTKEAFQIRLHQYEALVERLLAMLCALAYFDTGNNTNLLTKCIEWLVPDVARGGAYNWIDLQDYPALLLLYGAGLAALAAGRYDNLAAVLRQPESRDASRSEKVPAIRRLHVWSVFRNTFKQVPRPNAENEYTPANNYIADLMRPVLYAYLPNESEYTESFDTFEYLLALTHLDLVAGSSFLRGAFATRLECESVEEARVYRFFKKDLDLGTDGELVRAGFFGGDVERFRSISEKQVEQLLRLRERWLWL